MFTQTQTTKIDRTYIPKYMSTNSLLGQPGGLGRAALEGDSCTSSGNVMGCDDVYNSIRNLPDPTFTSPSHVRAAPYKSFVFVNQHMQSGIAINPAGLARSRIMLHLNFKAGSSQRYNLLSNTHYPRN